MHRAFSVAPVPSVHFPPNCRPTSRPSSARPVAAAQFHRLAYGQMPRPRSWMPHASWVASTVHVRSAMRTEPVAGRLFCFEVNWKRRSLQGITTLSDS